MSAFQTKARDWVTLSKVVFWDRDVDLEAWRAGVLRASPSYLPASVKRMTPIEFVRHLGRDCFIEHWPRLRLALDEQLSGRMKVLDLAWSKHSSGTWNASPVSATIKMPGRRREFYDHVVRHPGCSIYEAARDAGMPYRRAYDHFVSLRSGGLLRDCLDTAGPRARRRLFSY